MRHAWEFSRRKEKSWLQCIQIHARRSISTIERKDGTFAAAAARRQQEHGSLDHVVKELEHQSVGTSHSSYAALLKKCGNSEALSHGKRVHAHIVNTGLGHITFLQNLLVQMYGRCNTLDDARAVFDTIANRNTYSWNIMIAACIKNEHHRDALELFEQMKRECVHPDKFTYAAILGACCSLGALAEGKAIHASFAASGLQPDVVLETTLVNMYAKCGSLADARQIFASMGEKSVVSWNAMIAAFAQQGDSAGALELYRRLDLEGVKPDLCSFVSVLSACSSLRNLAEGKAIHGRIVACGYEPHVVLETALLDLYGKCGSIENAKAVFDRMQRRDIVSWNAMVAAYAQHGHGRKALELYQEMESQGFEPELVTFVNLLVACSNLGALAEGRAIHARLSQGKYQLNLVAENAILNMYAKCGSLEDAKRMFDEMVLRDVVSWNAMVAAYAEHGHGGIALDLCKHMVLDGVEPNDITLTCILLCCSHGGMPDEGKDYFISISSDHGITPVAGHYHCMIDLLGRAGRLKEAEELICVMPYEPGVVGWRAYLGACKTHSDTTRASSAADHASELNPKDCSAYVLLSNIYSTSQCSKLGRRAATSLKVI